MVIDGPNGATIFSVQGKYREYAYSLSIDSLGAGGVGRQEINFFGTPREVDYGPVSKVDYGRLNDEVALLVVGFTSGRIMFIETDARGDRFLPRNADSRKEFKQHQAAIADFAFSKNGKKLAVASYDGTVSVWDLERYSDPSYQPVILDRHSGWVLSVAFAHNDEFVISGCQDGSLYFWNVDPQQYAKFLCQLLEETGSAAREEQLKLESISRKSGHLRAFDELAIEDYRRYFGEAELRRVTRQIRVCE
jgi:WD40 repeat protein